MKNEASKMKHLGQMVIKDKKVNLTNLSLRKNVNDAHILVYVSMYNVMVRLPLTKICIFRFHVLIFQKSFPQVHRTGPWLFFHDNAHVGHN